MNFKYRLNYYKDEDGEYSDYKPCDKSTIDRIISDHWTNEHLPNGLETIVVTNKQGHSIILEHSRKEVFDAYYLPASRRFHYHKKSQINIIQETLANFMNNEIDELESSLNKTTKDNRYVRGDYFLKNHDYQLTRERSFRELLWFLWYGVPVAAIGNFVFISSLLKGPTGVGDFLSALLFLLANMLWIPGIILHYQYTQDAKGLIIRLTRGSDQIIIRTPLTKKVLLKSDIRQVTKVENPAYKIPWSEYGYIQIDFTSGEVINLTNLLADQLFILDKFEFDNVKKTSVRSGIPTLKRRTRIHSTAANNV
ncbi:hypothetical protein WBG78_23215 [Chryseolinea sp. T2]|uniref:hypothetical protein n=1 Tax=Chryseolinea sp. T2 TaxID=3129255 RepID=UPI00307793A6